MLNVWLFPQKISGMINNEMCLLQLPILGAYFSVKPRAYRAARLDMPDEIQ